MMQQHPNPSRRYVVTADGSQATLYSCTPGAHGRARVEKLDSVGNTHLDEHERHRPTLLDAARRGHAMPSMRATSFPHSASQGHEVEEEQRRFAHDVKNWLGRNREVVGAAPLTIFAPPHFLGLLRHQLGDPAGANPGAPDLRECELTHLQPNQLAEHPAVRSLLAF
jgi:protein required for attachment to host cells